MNRDYNEFFAALNHADVEYLVVGGHALAFHHVPRFTKDLDLWLRPTAENAKRVGDALAAYGVPTHDLDEGLLAQPDVWFKVGEYPNRIDLLTSIDGVAFAAAWADRIAGSYGSEAVQVISRHHLIANKEASGRPQDLVDVESLRGAP